MRSQRSSHAPDPPRNKRGQSGADPGTYIGRQPERATETIPGGIGPKDQRVSAVSTQPGAASPEDPTPAAGHRDGENTDDDTVREAGQNR
jgi:hypothetical protein